MLNYISKAIIYNSFRHKGAKIRNDLPNEIQNSIILAEFKNQIKKSQRFSHRFGYGYEAETFHCSKGDMTYY